MSTPGSEPPTERPDPTAARPPARPSATATPPVVREEDTDRPSTWQPLLWLKILLLLAVIAYVVAFVVQNTDKIQIDFVFADARVNLIWEILLLLAIGILSGVLLSQLYRRSARREMRQRRAEARDARRDVGRRDEAVRKPR